MKIGWRIFWVVELGLFVMLGYQLMTNPPALVCLVVGVLLCWLGLHVRRGHTLWLTLGWIAVVVAVFINPPVWVMLFLGVIACFDAFAGAGHIGNWARKQFIAVKTVPPTAKANQTTRHPWFGDVHIGAQVYEWDNLNLTVAAGDTIIDLGNTFLPKGDNIIVLHKGFGKTRILVPVGVGVMVSYSAGVGTLVLDGARQAVHGETIEHFSADYDDAVRRIHILANVLVGDVEVVAI